MKKVIPNFLVLAILFIPMFLMAQMGADTTAAIADADLTSVGDDETTGGVGDWFTTNWQWLILLLWGVVTKFVPDWNANPILRLIKNIIDYFIPNNDGKNVTVGATALAVDKGDGKNLSLHWLNAAWPFLAALVGLIIANITGFFDVFQLTGAMNVIPYAGVLLIAYIVQRVRFKQPK